MTSIEKSTSDKRIAIVGAGLGGALCACFFAKHGIQVYLFEQRADIRTQKVMKGRSINMALSERGRAALAYVDCEDLVVDNGIPMRARMLHNERCHTHAVPYSIRPQHELISIDRRILNELLLDEASKHPEIEMHFQYKFHHWDSKAKTATFLNPSGEHVDFNVDAIIGYDGCHSAVRAAMMRVDAINFSQEYVDSYYMELSIPPRKDEFAIEKNYLHIWPRHEFMLIALPNQDKSFTTTLFLPLSIFGRLKTADEVLTFFQEYFPDAISLIGRESLIETFLSSKPLSLCSIRCSPHVSSLGDMLIMGDAAHSMAPFYAQGMNSAFEDILILFEKLKENDFQFAKAFHQYNETRVHDAHAVVDLSMYNFKEMQHLVTQRSYSWRKKIDDLLYRYVPNLWIPLYTMVTFTRIPYGQCIQLRERQNKILRIIRSIGYAFVGLYAFKQLALYVIKPLAIQFIVRKILPKYVADRVV